MWFYLKGCRKSLNGVTQGSLRIDPSQMSTFCWYQNSNSEGCFLDTKSKPSLHARVCVYVRRWGSGLWSWIRWREGQPHGGRIEGGSRAPERPGAGEESLEATLNSAPRNSRRFGHRQWVGLLHLLWWAFRRGRYQSLTAHVCALEVETARELCIDIASAFKEFTIKLEK